MHNDTIQSWLNSSYLTKANQCYIEELYKQFLSNPKSIDIYWRKFFNALSNEHDVFETNDISVDVQVKIFQLIHAFRTHGHQHATLDPLKLWKRKSIKNLDLNFYKFTKKDLQTHFHISKFAIHNPIMKLHDLYTMLQKIYCNDIGIEYMHIDNMEEVAWIQKNIEPIIENIELSLEEKKQVLYELIATEGIEKHLGTKFPGAKRFSLEGGDVLIPMLKESVRYAANDNIHKIILSMAHRGRLNVLINILGKKPKDLYNEFSNKNCKIYKNSGDVKYHQGLSSNINIQNSYIQLLLLSNPSHLEIINPVAMGVARAHIDLLQNINSENIILPISIHGDAAISGQGIVQETLNMSKVPAYNVNGTIRIVINNQIGFTTSNISHIRSSQYCTDIGKVFQIPIFHVNADNPEAAIFVMRTALNFRKTFKRDVLIDLVCYRRHGHNEMDEPRVTQPIMYNIIHNHPTVSQIYSQYLESNNFITVRDTLNIHNAVQNHLDQGKTILNDAQVIHNNNLLFNTQTNNDYCYNKIDFDQLKNIAYKISDLPKDFIIHPRVNKIYQDRMSMAKGEKLFDWGGAETLAYATLLSNGISIRLSGEDTSRGTFFHRHAIVYNQNNENLYIPLTNIQKNQGKFFVWDSVLSEESALAFEYGYSLFSGSNTLTIWEAQFGDFSNGAQIVIDQFISSGEQKWEQTSGLVMLLPHGYEGQGPEHSSSRLERYLQLCAENNMVICIPSTPAQFYHILLHHSFNKIHKPLIIMSPKSLLRHSMVRSSFNDLIYGNFQKVIAEMDRNIYPKQTKRVLICSGKIFYDLLENRNKNKQYNVSIIRIEQLYPFPLQEINTIFDMYKHINDFIWCQEEPKNQGAWQYIQNHLSKIIINHNNHATLNYIGRPTAASPAVGYLSVHQNQQMTLLNHALNVN